MPMKIPLRIAVGFVVLLAAIVLPADAAPKIEVALFKYKGASGSISGEKFEMFQGIIKDKIHSYRRDIMQWNSDSLSHLKGFRVTLHEKDTFTTNSGINDWMTNQAILCLLRGTIVSDDNKTYQVKSDIHLGELKGFLSDDIVSISLPVSIAEHENTQDSHSLVIFYALAMDAKRMGYDESYMRLLEKAKDILANIKINKDKLEGSLAALEDAIKQAEAAMPATSNLGGSDSGN